MSLINSGPLRIQPVVTHGKSTSPFAGADRTRLMFVCPRAGCGKEFARYAGMRRFGSGVGLCQDHNGPQL